MKLISTYKIAIAASTFACATLLSVDWSEQRGVSLSIESAQARIGRPLTPVSVAGVARRQYRRSTYGYGYGAGVVGAGVAAAAIGTAAVAATSPWGYSGNAYYGNGYDSNAYYGGGSDAGGYYASSSWGDYECRPPHTYDCRPHAARDWGTGTNAGYVAQPYVGSGYYGVGAGYYGRPLARAAYYRAMGY